MHPLGKCYYEHICYYINCSVWAGPPELTGPIYGLIMPIVILATLILNTLIIVVLNKAHMQVAGH